MRTIAVMNQKGGCGKTTISINLAGALAALERKILLIDLDPQAHASVGIGMRQADVEVTSYELLMDPATRIEEAIQKVSDNLDIVTSSTVLSGVEQELAERLGREERLASKLSQLDTDAYDYVLIDCPPSVGLLTFNALIASEEVLIPVDASYFSLHGLSKLRETIEVIEEELHKRLKVHAVCNNLETRTHCSKDILQEIEKFHSAVLVDTFISHTVRLKESAAQGVTIFDLDRQSKAARQFLALGRELIEREQKIRTENLQQWIEKLHGPQRVPDGVLFTLDQPQARQVAVTGEFTNWSREGVPLQRDPNDELWKIVLDIEPGEYEYRYIVDGTWIRDPNNVDYTRNEFDRRTRSSSSELARIHKVMRYERPPPQHPGYCPSLPIATPPPRAVAHAQPVRDQRRQRLFPRIAYSQSRCGVRQATRHGARLRAERSSSQRVLLSRPPARGIRGVGITGQRDGSFGAEWCVGLVLRCSCTRVADGDECRPHDQHCPLAGAWWMGRAFRIMGTEGRRVFRSAMGTRHASREKHGRCVVFCFSKERRSLATVPFIRVRRVRTAARDGNNTRSRGAGPLDGERRRSRARCAAGTQRAAVT